MLITRRASFVVVIAAVGLCAFVIESWSQQPSPSAGESRQPQEANSQATQPQPSTNQQDTEQKPLIVSVLPPQHIDEEAEQDRQDREAKATLEWRTLLLAALTTIVLFLQLFVFGWQGWQPFQIQPFMIFESAKYKNTEHAELIFSGHLYVYGRILYFDHMNRERSHGFVAHWIPPQVSGPQPEGEHFIWMRKKYWSYDK
jgi:hypothetical protein